MKHLSQKNRRRSARRALVASGAVLAITLAGCSSATEPDGPVQLEFWHSMDGKNAEAVEKIVSDFNTANKGKFEVTATFQGNYDQTIAKLSAGVQGGELPDILQVNDVNTSYMVDTKLTTPAEDLLKAADAQDVVDGLVPITASYYTVEGTLQSLPFQISQPAVYIRKDALEASGVSLDTFPKDVAGLTEWAQSISDKTGKAGLGFHMTPWWFEQLTAGAGLEYCTPGNGVGAEPATAFTVASDEQVAQWTALAELYKTKAGFDPGSDGSAVQAAFASGDVAAIFATSGAFGDISSELRDKFVMAPFPSPGGNVVPGGNSIWAMDDLSGAQKEAAGAFLAYAGSAEVQSYIFENTGYLPVASEALDAASESADANQKVLLDQLKNTPADSVSTGCHSGAMQAVRAEVQTAMEDILAGGDVRSALTAVEEKAVTLVKEYNERVQ